MSFGYTILSYIETSLLHYDTGLEYSRRAIACGTPDEVTWSNKGYCELNLGRFDSAKASFTRALGVNPELTTAYYGLGQAALRGFADTAGAVRNFRIYRDKESNPRTKARANEILRALGSE